ncbi:unnamed protein product [Ambrosiozyma monospora]|uniref:Unnamed protein product n=1 Tax=Ambrosiozyma monospora TaxID=43982 RepID=A0ACB5TCT2_AMBMO|nr:unnamed protein product [Ambrosiozyma monospora]
MIVDYGGQKIILHGWWRSFNDCVLLRSGKVIVINVRENVFEIEPITSFYPQLINDDDYRRVITTDPNIDLPPLSVIAINSLVLIVGSYNGKAELYDVLTGEFLRGLTDKISRKTLDLISNQLLPISNIQTEQDLSAGVLIFGPVVRFFKFGDYYKDMDKKKRKILAGDRKPSSNDVKRSLEEYEYESYHENLKYEMLDRYNGQDAQDSDEELQMAMALSASMNNSSVNVTNSSSRDIPLHNDVDEDLLRAIELSKLEGESDADLTSVVETSHLRETSSRTSDTIAGKVLKSDSDNDLDEALDEDLKRALELSRQEFNRVGKQPAYEPEKDENSNVKDVDNDDMDDMDDDLRLAIELSKQTSDFDWRKEGSSTMRR